MLRRALLATLLASTPVLFAKEQILLAIRLPSGDQLGNPLFSAESWKVAAGTMTGSLGGSKHAGRV
jgi:hypothetical protein